MKLEFASFSGKKQIQIEYELTQRRLNVERVALVSWL
jgi:hypothetical protein